MNKTAEQLIGLLDLIAHPEGGHYRQIYQSKDTVISTTAHKGEKKYASTSIYYLLRSNEFSAWHRIKSDELWHYYYGSPLAIYVIEKNGKLIVHTLGNPLTTKDACFQVVVPANQWFAAKPILPDSFTLAGCTVAPGFEFSDFELAKQEELKHLCENNQIPNLFIR